MNIHLPFLHYHNHTITADKKQGTKAPIAAQRDKLEFVEQMRNKKRMSLRGAEGDVAIP